MKTRLLKRLRKEAKKAYIIRLTRTPEDKNGYALFRQNSEGLCEVLDNIDINYAKKLLKTRRIAYIRRRCHIIRYETYTKHRIMQINKELSKL